MINFSYVQGWDKDLRQTTLEPINSADLNLLDQSNNVLSWAGLKNAEEKEDTQAKHAFIQQVLALDPNNNVNNVHLLSMLMIEKVMLNFDATDCLHGLFSALWEAERGVSPFIATQNYCIKVLNVSPNGQVTINASPIYHLGPEYMDEYKLKHGADLTHDAIVDLKEIPAGGMMNKEHKKFQLGIDAGIAFKTSKVPHNKILTLQLDIINKGIVASLTCESQTTAKTFNWFEIGIDYNASSNTPELVRETA